MIRSSTNFLLAGLMVMFFITLVVCPGCYKDNHESGKLPAITITDMKGRQVKIPSQLKRAVCIGPGSLRLLVYLGLQTKLCGIEAFEKRYPNGRPYYMAWQDSLCKLPVSSYGGASSINNIPDLELLLSVNPQLIITHLLDREKSDRLQERLGIPVLCINYGAFASFDERMLKSLQLLGKAFGVSERADEIIRFINNARHDLKARTSQLSRNELKKVYIGGLGFKGSQGLESTDTSYVPFQWISVNNVACTIRTEGHLYINRERLLQLDPDYIFIDAGGLSILKNSVKSKTAYYQALTAFQHNRVYLLFPFNSYVTNIGTAIVDAYAIGKILYPRNFQDIDLQAKSRSIYTFLLGRDVYDKMIDLYGALGKKQDFINRLETK